MRVVSVEREKSFVGSLMSIKLYIEDEENGDAVIDNCVCRKLGELKNGEKKNFETDEKERKLYAIADIASSKYCFDCTVLPEGEWTVNLKGKKCL